MNRISGMNRALRRVILFASAVLIIVAASNIDTRGCRCSAPLVLFGSILGCSGPSPDDTAGTGADRGIAEAKDNAGAAPLKREYSGPVKVTFVELGSVNCIPCRMMQPVMKQVEETYPGQVRVVFHDVWTEQGRPYGMKYGIRGIPTQIFLDAQGSEYFRHTGYFPFDEIEKILKEKGVE